MKHQTPESMKFRKLQRRLGVSRLVTVGTLELLWLATQKNAPQGDIGRFSDEELAVECEWEGDPSALVNALVECGWLDRCREHRLVVHDWEEHAPGWVKRQLARHKRSFVTVSRLLPVTDDTQEATPKERKGKETQPNLTKGKETQPNLSVNEDVDGQRITPEDFLARWNAFAKKTPKISPIRSLTKDRKKKLATRLAESGWLDTFKISLKQLPLGETEGSTWQPGFDWLIRNETNAARLAEGEFSWRNKDDPAREKRQANLRRIAAEQREVEIAEERKNRKCRVRDDHAIIESILRHPSGSGGERAGSSLLSGLDDQT